MESSKENTQSLNWANWRELSASENGSTQSELEETGEVINTPEKENISITIEKGRRLFESFGISSETFDSMQLKKRLLVGHLDREQSYISESAKKRRL